MHSQNQIRYDINDNVSGEQVEYNNEYPGYNTNICPKSVFISKIFFYILQSGHKIKIIKLSSSGNDNRLVGAF